MSITSNRRVVNQFDGDYDLDSVAAAAANSSSPGSIVDIALASGANTITPPIGATGATILMPSGNTVLVTLRGVSADTGIVLHLTDPTSLGLNNSATTFVLNAASTLSIRIIWS